MVCTDCYGTHSGLDHGTHGLSVEPDPSLLETMGERDAIALAQVQARYNLYRRMYTNCTVVNGNLEIVFLIGPNNQTYSLDFLRNIREVTLSRMKIAVCNIHIDENTVILAIVARGGRTVRCYYAPNPNNRLHVHS